MLQPSLHNTKDYCISAGSRAEVRLTGLKLLIAVLQISDHPQPSAVERSSPEPWLGVSSG